MSPSLEVVAAAVGLPFAAAAATPATYRLVGERTGYVAAAVAAASFALVATQAGAPGTVAAPWIPALDVALRFTVDGWALLFGGMASGVGVLVFTYSATYMHGESNLVRYYATLLAFMGSILGVAFAADLVVLFVFWELTSVCSFVLIAHHADEERSLYAARMAMVVTVGGGLALLVGLLVLSLVAAGALGGPTFDLAAMLSEAEAVRGALRDAGAFLPVLVLFGVAAAAKSAQVPLHVWLPNAMAAPTPVSAFLHSATMVTLGVYVVGRLRPLLVGPEWTLLFATLGLATMTVGALLAVLATDTKRLLAYSTASHLGLMVAGFGFGSKYGAGAGAFHLLNHALFKAALFLVAGIVAHEAGSRDLRELGGLAEDLPVTAAVTGVAALSMAGIPPFNGFYSKELLFEATYEAATGAGGLAWLYPAVALVASVFTVLYSLRFLWLFLGDRPEGLGEVHRPPAGLVGPPAVLAGLALVAGLAPQRVFDATVADAVAVTGAGHPDLHVGLPTYLSTPVAMSAVTVVGGVAAFPAVERVRTGVGRANDAAVALRPSRWYDRLLAGSAAASARLDALVHGGLLRTYVAWALGAASALALLGYGAGGVALPAIEGAGVPPAVALVLAVAVIAAVAAVVAPSHVVGVLALSVFGFMLAIFYILASAPDLALTQLVVETLVLLIFLLVLEELPAFYGDRALGVELRDAALSTVVGAAAFVSVLAAGRGPDEGATAVAGEYLDRAVPEAGGHNVVNVVLVDFRAFDTLGEIIVVAVAAIGVLVLVRMRDRGEVR